MTIIIWAQDHEAVLELSQNLCSLIVLIENIKQEAQGTPRSPEQQ